MKIEELKTRLAKVKDPRRTDRGNIRHKPQKIIVTTPGKENGKEL